MKKKKVFLACPVRNIEDSYRDGIIAQIDHLEKKGYEVYCPIRDTNQGVLSLEICKQNKAAIKNCDLFYVIWDGKSQGVLFDLGIAFALGKKVRGVVGYLPAQTYHKSFQNLIYQLEETP